ncbi:hypothetical protein [Pseudanabaena sp. FACHB-2040]|uniref:hypothetical protein n=1 Tax=Pseudanabaena sp. FACHB-2040 TaxID=2692859 RepID=UPI0018EFD742|nr:hypothetical protein [Pseudanabaena sp. FACHB-2040]
MTRSASEARGRPDSFQALRCLGQLHQHHEQLLQGLHHNPKDRTTEKACPFNLMYWDFLARYYEKLQPNPRMRQILRNLERIPTDELQHIRQKAADWRTQHAHTEHLLPDTPKPQEAQALSGEMK